MVLENGQVKAFGSLEDVWGSSVMHPGCLRNSKAVF